MNQRVKYVNYTLIFLLIGIFNLQGQDGIIPESAYKKDIIVGAERLDDYLSKINDKNIGIIANQSSLVSGEHLVDVLLDKSIKIKKVFAPEHGFRGFADAGELVKDGKDQKTGLDIVSLYGKNKKPTSEQLAGLDLLIFDIQDVGARFYTYISTMHYAMEACAENGVEFMVLDRPNPNGFYIDGPVLKPQFKSFVGMHEVPVVHGMTIGEYAQMINEEGWLAEGQKCALHIVKCSNYTHKDLYKLPVKPSPNLPTMTSVYLYPSLAFFEGTIVSVGRGTDKPFQQIGHPAFEGGDIEFTPKPMPGARYPKLEGENCKGIDLSNFGSFYLRHTRRLYLYWISEMNKNLSGNLEFFSKSNFFNKLAGNAELQKQIRSGMDEIAIRASWQEELNAFKLIRNNYLLYPDFE
ncbi:MAG: DUF1343 domain-containing protein [Bacteroidota bacterium]